MRILFQGDSITDAYRARDNDWNLGIGYPRLVNAHLGLEEAGEHEFFNRGISGNRIVDLYARIKRDIINLKPDVMSILIGVNDVWHGLDEKSPNGVDEDRFYDVYCMLIEDVKKALPNIKIMILEPFVLKASATEGKWDVFKSEVEIRAQKAREVAQKYDLTFVELQSGFDTLCEKAPADYWLGDGVHPSANGHEFIKREWLKAYYAMRGNDR